MRANIGIWEEKNKRFFEKLKLRATFPFKDSTINNWNRRRKWKINRERRSIDSTKSKEEQQTVLDLRKINLNFEREFIIFKVMLLSMK